QVDLRLQQIALRLGDEKTGRQPDRVAALLRVEPLLRQRRAGAGGVFALGRAAQLPPGLANRLRDVELQARNARLGLPPFDAGAHGAHLLEAAADRVTDRHAKTPGRIIAPERLAEHVAEP